MSNNIDNFSVAINIINRKIAELNIKVTEEETQELKDKLDKYLKIKQEICDGDTLLIKKIIDGEIK